MKEAEHARQPVNTEAEAFFQGKGKTKIVQHFEIVISV